VLEAVADAHDVVGVVTQPDRPAGRGHKLTATPVKRAALARGLRVLAPEKLRPFADEARALGADAFVVASYGRIVPQPLLDVVPVAFNVHPSLLPLYRGATPLQSAIRDGRDETGVTIIAMDAGMDTGDVLLQERTPIGPQETYGELHDRLAKRGAEMVVEALRQYANGTLERKPQSVVARELGISDEEIARTLTRPLRKMDVFISWSSVDAKRAVDVIRSLSPEPGARTLDDRGDPLRLIRAHETAFESCQPDIVLHAHDGKLIVVQAKPPRGNGVAVERSDGWLVFDKLVASGKGEMDALRYGQMLWQRIAKAHDEAHR
jgi:methionyl-tRNA formyltransferase